MKETRLRLFHAGSRRVVEKAAQSGAAPQTQDSNETRSPQVGDNGFISRVESRKPEHEKYRRKLVCCTNHIIIVVGP